MTVKQSLKAFLIFLLTYSQAFAGAPVIWSGTRSQALTSKGLVLSDSSVVDNDGPLNYIKNGHGEVSATGWSAYADAAGTTPVDCTGGSPSETITQSTSSPLVGAGSLLLTKGATNRQGDGASYAFTLDSAYTSQPVAISMLTSGSANYAASDVGIYVYDVTNSTLITPSAVNIAAGSYQYQAFFMASTSTSYRLCVHTASTNASAYTLKIDSVYVGPTKQVSGAGYQDWTSYTPTFGSGWGTVTSGAGWYRRVGDTMEIRIFGKTGTVAASATSVSLPGTYAIDTTKIKNASTGAESTAVGVITMEGTTHVLSLVTNNNTSSNTICVGNYSSSAGNECRSGTDALASTSEFSMWANVPISTWSSNITMADRALEECAYNTSTSTTANDTTSFAYGCNGAQIQNITAALTRRIRFQTPIQPTDTLLFEYSSDRLKWFNFSSGWQLDSNSANYNISGYIQANSKEYGAGRLSLVTGTTTDVDVKFGTYSTIDGTSATYGANGVAWSGGAGGAYWRVRKVTGGAMAGLPIAPANITNTLTDAGNYAGNTRMGLMVYSHGGSYNGGNAPTVTLSSGGGTLSTVYVADFIPYQVADSTWRMKFNINVQLSSAARTAPVLAIAGVTFFAFGNDGQAIEGTNFGSAAITSLHAQQNTGNIQVLHASATTTEYAFSGDVKLNSKPTWAY